MFSLIGIRNLQKASNCQFFKEKMGCLHCGQKFSMRLNYFIAIPCMVIALFILAATHAYLQAYAYAAFVILVVVILNIVIHKTYVIEK